MAFVTEEITLEEHNDPLIDYNPAPQNLAGSTGKRPNQTTTQILPSWREQKGHGQLRILG